MAENAANGTVVGITASASDADATTNSVTYDLVDGGGNPIVGGAFTIDASTGVVTVADASQLDHDTAATHTIHIRATSADGSTSTESFTVDITDVNEAPTDLAAVGNNSITSSIPVGTMVGTMAAIDPDAGDAHTYALTNDAGGMFAIDANTGQISLVGGTASAPEYSQQTGSGNPFDGIDVGTNSSPVFVDIDGDGDLDMFSGDGYYGGNFEYYENTGTATNPVFSSSASHNPFGLSDQGNYTTPTFVDIDGDGDMDAFAGYSDGRIRYFENTGDANNPSFASATADPFGFGDVGSYSDITFADIDNDGDLDAFVGESDGTINYYENTGNSSSPSFTLRTGSANPLNGIDVGSYSSPEFVDADGDGDLDVFIGESDGTLNYYENTGTDSSPTFTAAGSNPFGYSDIGSDSQFAFADLDGDGSLDLIVGESSGNMNYFENGATSGMDMSTASSHTVTVETTDSAGQTYSEDVTLHFGTDGEETITGGTGTDIIYGMGGADMLNGGDGDDWISAGTVSTAPSFQHQTGASNPFNGIDVGAEATPTLVDIDNDGDLDMFVGAADGTLNYYENTGTATNPSFVAATSPFGSLDVGGDSNPTFVDIDGDGDMDAFIGENDGVMNYFENTGTASNPAFASGVTGAFGIPDIGEDSAPTFVDIDNDGDMDLFVGEGDGGVVNFFENTGTATSASFASGTTNPFGLSGLNNDTEFTFADIDGDGDLDAVYGDDDGNLYYQENTGTASNPTFAAAVMNPFGFADVGEESSPTFADMDGDGDLDLIVGVGSDNSSSYNGTIAYFENTTASASGSTLNGGDGDDTLVSGNAADTLNGGAGTDTVDYSGADTGVAVAFDDVDGWGIGGNHANADAGGISGDAKGDSYSSIEGFVGTDHNDLVYGASTDMSYDLGAGNDIFDSNAATSGNDTIDAGAGNDSVWSGSGDDRITGGAGNDQLNGEDGNDLFMYAAGDGSDTINGGAGIGWTDAIELQGMDGAVSIAGNTVTGQGWTMELDAGSSIDGQNGESLDLSDDASGTITFDDGSTMDFSNIEQINW